ncbi:esterase/lipase family protein [Bdellovibrio sp.]|uniref:esterase/lipase family protein n=1 Tax=Bdellovibrio sp. TaxID=28201 RepID=UPI0039E507C7
MKRPIPNLFLFVLLGFLTQSPVVKGETLHNLLKTEERELWGSLFEGRLVSFEIFENSIPSKEGAVVLVHGMSGSIHNFSSLLFSTSELTQYSLFYFAYDDMHRSLRLSAQDLAEELRKLNDSQITLIAHSMGGVVARAALDILAKDTSSSVLPRIHLIAVYTPWHGGYEKSCRKKGSSWDRVVEFFLPAAVVDMRACSQFLNETQGSQWPEQFSMTLFFAEKGAQAWDYSEEPLKELPQKILEYIEKGEPVRGSLTELHFWQALRRSSRYPQFEMHLRGLLSVSELSLAKVREDLKFYFPRLPGNHTTVLEPHLRRPRDFPRVLQQLLY